MSAGGSAGGVLKEKERVKEKERGEIEIGVCVRWFSGRTRATENTCGRRTRADGERVPTWGTRDASGQQWANARREVATPFSFSLFI